MSGAVQRNLWNPGESFRISEESLGLNETKGNSCGIFKNKILFFFKGEIREGTNWKTKKDPRGKSEVWEVEGVKETMFVVMH